MKNKKRKLLITILVGLIIVALIVVLGYKFNFKNYNKLTLEENKWIDQNKYDVVDVAILNDIPILSYDGEGIVYNYLDYITKNHSLKFNVIPYKLDGNVEYNYKMSVVDKTSKNDIKLFKDNLVLLTTTDIQYNDINEINNLRLGILSSDKELISNYLNNDTITYVEYNNYVELKNSIIDAKTKLGTDQLGNVDAIIVLKTTAVKEIVENDINIAYHFNDLNKYFVLQANGDTELNSILQKSFNSWKLEYFDEEYNEELLNNYYKFKQLSDVEQKTLKSKSYVYGFINFGIYNYIDNNKLSGINGVILKEFNKFSGLSISYIQYNSAVKLISDFNSGKVDFVFDMVDNSKFTNSTYNTVDVFDKKLVVVSDINSNITIDSLKSLRGKEVLTVKDSYIEDYLKANDVKISSYNNVNDLMKDFGYNDIVVIDLENYNFYKSSYLKDSKIDYILTIEDNYNYIINDKEDNKLFESIFDFYLSFNSMNKLLALNYDDIAYQNFNLGYVLSLIILILILYIVLDFSNHIKSMMKMLKKTKKVKMKKEEKIMYIDQLTSLKNRNYLNSKIESWDESEVYPQSIIVMDLNNISYINDNYGREEGDKVITEAANILIQNQLQNSEIIRTDGNEFLIYLVGYTEKQIISYLRKLSKEFKNLSHGFGVASGYSIITDAIKTIDDAVNEATLAMKENKEDINY